MAGCDSIITIDLSLGYTGLNHFDEIVLNVFPNSTTGIVNIIGNRIDQNTIRINNVYGRELAPPLYSIDQGVRYNLSDLASGVYFIVLNNDNHTVIRIIRD
ncbi:MAG: T9SS type A sorting domain-containing protein [Crocinitomicaceae bacterium]|nr:T9SS type A sorting domain-containing protein [Crocinitomicaceae bacterium]